MTTKIIEFELDGIGCEGEADGPAARITIDGKDGTTVFAITTKEALYRLATPILEVADESGPGQQTSPAKTVRVVKLQGRSSAQPGVNNLHVTGMGGESINLLIPQQNWLGAASAILSYAAEAQAVKGAAALSANPPAAIHTHTVTSFHVEPSGSAQVLLFETLDKQMVSILLRPGQKEALLDVLRGASGGTGSKAN